jgi:hypothetical protein
VGGYDQENSVNISDEDYRRIAETIHSDTSPVGIDAQKTHVMILSLLEQIDARLARVEEALAADK